MKRELYCKDCGKYMGVVHKGSLRAGMVVLCKVCHDAPVPKYDVPDFMRSVFK